MVGLTGLTQPLWTYRSNLRSFGITVSMPCLDLVPTEYESFVQGSWPASLKTLVDAPPTLRAIALELMLVNEADSLSDFDEDEGNLFISFSDLASKLEALDWSLLDLAITNHTELEIVTINVTAHDLLEKGQSTEHFVGEVRKMLVRKCFGTPARRGLLDVVISE